MICIDNALLGQISAQAAGAARRRMNYNFHRSESDTVQRMLNALEPGTYIRPHRHADPGKNEVFLILRGKALVIEFDDDGTLADAIVLDASAGIFGAEIPPARFHTILSIESGTVVYELKEGPYLPLTVKYFAPWAPGEGSTESADYLENLRQQSGL